MRFDDDSGMDKRDDEIIVSTSKNSFDDKLEEFIFLCRKIFR